MKKYAVISDPTSANAGRMYDYMLGGIHNFEIDRQKADELLKINPFVRQMCMLVRGFVKIAVKLLVSEGYTRFVDFASGLPTKDNVHCNVPEECKVFYSDIDPETVYYSKRIIGDCLNVYYFECDVRKPQRLLEYPYFNELIENERKVAVGLNGVAYFLSDDELKYISRSIYDWVAPGSKLYMCDGDLQDDDNNLLSKAMELYKSIGQPIFVRTKDELKTLMEPWKVSKYGIHNLEQWYKIQDVKNIDLNILSTPLYGLILEKPI